MRWENSREMNVIVAIVGMCGSGKSVACDVLKAQSWAYIRFGQLTIDRLMDEGRDITPENEKEMREGLRQKHGMGAFAQLLLPKIEAAHRIGLVVIDGLYSWSEYRILKDKYPETLKIVHIYASPQTRYRRLSERAHGQSDQEHRMRKMTPEQAKRRDYAEIENIEKGGPIAMADVTLINEKRLVDLEDQMRNLANHWRESG